MNLQWRGRAAVLLGLFLLALGVRLAVAAVVGVSQKPVSDEIEYYQFADSFSRGEGLQKVPQQSPDGVAHPSAYRMPVPSMLMGLGFAVFGHHYAVARYVAIVAGSLAAPLMYLFTRRFAGPPVATLASVGVALHPVLIFNTVLMASEPFFISAMLLALDLSVLANRARTVRSGLWAGLAWGLAILVRPHAAPMAFLVMLYMLRSSWKSAFALSFGVVVLLVPWVVRNQIAVGYPVLMATEGGETFLGANNPYVLNDPTLRGMWKSPMLIPEYRDHLKPIRNELKRNAEQYRLAKEFLARNPEVIPKLGFYKLIRWLTPVTVSRGMIRLVLLGTYGLLLVLLTVGLFTGTFRRSDSLHMVLLCTAVLTAITTVYWGALTRGRIPLEILWIPWGASAAWDLIGRLTSWRLKGSVSADLLGSPVASVAGPSPH